MCALFIVTHTAHITKTDPTVYAIKMSEITADFLHDMRVPPQKSVGSANLRSEWGLLCVCVCVCVYVCVCVFAPKQS